MPRSLRDSAESLFQKILSLIREGKLNKALIELDKAEEIAKLLLEDSTHKFFQTNLKTKFNNVFALAYRLDDLGHFYRAQHFYDLSLLISQKRLQTDPENESYQSDVAMTLNNLGNLLSNMGRFEDAKNRYEEALDIYEKLLQTDLDNIAYQSYVGGIFNNIGNLLSDMGRLEAAKNRYEEALDMRQKLLQTDPDNVVYQSYLGVILNNLGALLKNMGRLEDAKNRYEGAFDIYEKLLQTDPDNFVYQSDVAMTLNNLGNLLSDMGRLEDAKNRYENALNIFEKLLHIDPENVAYQSYLGVILNNLSTLLSDMGRLEDAKNRYENALNIYEKLLQTDPDNVVYQSYVGTTLNNLGNLFSDMGHLEDAKDRYEKTLDIRQKLLQTDPNNDAYQLNIGTTLNNLGNLLSDMGRLEDAKNTYEKALYMRQKLLQTDPDNVVYQSYVGTTLSNLGILLSDMGRLEDAKNRYEEALDIRQKLLQTDLDNVAYQSDVAMTLNNLGTSLFDIGRLEDAKNTYEKALYMRQKLLQTDPDNVVYQSYVGTTLNNLGILLQEEENYSTALEFHSRSLSYSSKSANSNLLFRVYWSFGRLYDKVGFYYNAFIKYRESIDCIESIRNQYSIEETKMDIMWDKSAVYTDMISFLCTRIKDPEKAWEYLERTKSRTLLDSLRFLELEAPQNVPKVLLAQEKELHESLIVFDRLRRKTEKADERNQLTQKIKEKEDLLNELYYQIQKISPEYVDLRRGQPLGIEGIKELAKNQTKRTAFVEYYTTAEKVFIFLMRSDENVPKVETVDLTERNQLSYVKKYFEDIVINKGKGLEMWTNLSKFLLDPVFDDIKDCELVYLVPHGFLHYLPLHALLAEDKRLIEHFPITYSPSLTAIKYSQSKPARKFETCLSMGYTPKENEKVVFEREAELVAGLFNADNAELKLGQEATSRILENANNDVIHIACHGEFDWENSLNSGLILADKYLKVKEIFNLSISTKLLVLSACETGLNERKPGDELIGLTRAFLYAGAESLIVSLWSVSQDSTLEFMNRFYRKVKEGNMNKAEALQQTQIEFIHEEQHSNPYLWAPFVLIGDWK